MSSHDTACALSPGQANHLNPEELTRCLQVVQAWQEKQEQYQLHGGQPTMQSVTPPPESVSPPPIQATTAAAAPHQPRLNRTIRSHASAMTLAGGRPSTATSAAPSYNGGGGAAYVPQHAARQFLLTTGGRSAVRYGSRQTSRFGGSTCGSRNGSGDMDTSATARARDGNNTALRPWRSMGTMRRAYRTAEEEDVPAMPNILAHSSSRGHRADSADDTDDTIVPVDAAADAMQEHAPVDWTQSDELRAPGTSAADGSGGKGLPLPAHSDHGAAGPDAAGTSPTKEEAIRPLGLLRRIKSRMAVGSRAAAAAPPVPADEKRPTFLSLIGFRSDD